MSHLIIVHEFQALKCLLYKIEHFGDSVKWRIIEVSKNWQDYVFVVFVLGITENLENRTAVILRIIFPLAKGKILLYFFFSGIFSNSLNEDGEAVLYASCVDTFRTLNKP